MALVIQRKNAMYKLPPGVKDLCGIPVTYEEYVEACKMTEKVLEEMEERSLACIVLFSVLMVIRSIPPMLEEEHQKESYLQSLFPSIVNIMKFFEEARKVAEASGELVDRKFLKEFDKWINS